MTIDRLTPVAPAPRAERLAGRYLLRRALGAGAFGHVWEAHDTHLDRPVAIKWVPADLDAETVQERASELASVRSPQIAQVLDLQTDEDGRRFLVMELANGPAVASILGDILPFDAVCSIGKTALSGLAAMHSHGVVHGAVVPSSLMLTHSHGERQLRWTGFHLGRDGGAIPAGYAAPELSDAGAEITTQADIFGLGAMLFQLISGELPFPPSYYMDAEDLQRAMQETPWEVVAALGRLPPMVAGVLERALAPDPARRYRDATEMRAACASVFG